MQQDRRQRRTQQGRVHSGGELAALGGPLVDPLLRPSSLGARNLSRNSAPNSGSVCSGGDHHAEDPGGALARRARLRLAEQWRAGPRAATRCRDSSASRGPVRAAQCVDDERLLGGPAAVERGLAGPRLVGDPVHRQPVVADLEELGSRRRRGSPPRARRRRADGAGGRRAGLTELLAGADGTKRFRFIRTVAADAAGRAQAGPVSRPGSSNIAIVLLAGAPRSTAGAP